MPIQLYLLRHADALPTVPDEERHLSPKGFSQIEALASFLKNKEAFSPNALWHSGYKRAEQTATCLLKALDLKLPIELMPSLSPNSSVEPLVRRLRLLNRNILIVSHNPYLESLASQLLSDANEDCTFQFKKASLMTLEKRTESSPWQLGWLICPKLYMSM